MKRLLILSLLAAFLVGCGDPAPSTPLAPDQAMPDTSKMSAEEIQKLHQAGSAGGSDRGVPGAAATPTSPSGATPSDRGG